MQKIERPEWFTKAEFDRLIAEGYTQVRIAEEVLYVSKETARRFFKEMEVGKAPSRRLERPEWFTADHYAKFRKAGMNHKDMAKKLGVSEPIFYRFMDEIGITRERGRRLRGRKVEA